MDASEQSPDRPPKVYRLRTVTGRIKALLLDASTKEFWVRAQLVISKSNPRGGHLYCDLVDVDDDGKQVARMEAVIWRQQHEGITRKLRQAGQSNALANNNEVCVLCSVRYHEIHGLKLHVHDIDPHWGEGQIDRNRRIILARLKQEGILEKNKVTVVPTPALRIGLITGRDSAAFNDFRHTLVCSTYAFKIILAPSAMQGESCESQVLNALSSLIRANVDVICLVRGGGSQVDLAWLDNERIARAIINCPVPVLTGIGHEIDMGVLDFVAHTSFKTPTAVAETLVTRVKELDGRLHIAEERLQEITERRISLGQLHIQKNLVGLLQGSRKHLSYFTATLQHVVLRVKSSLEQRSGSKEKRLGECIIQFREKTSALIAEKLRDLRRVQDRLPEYVDRNLTFSGEVLTRQRGVLIQATRKHLDLYGARLSLFMSRLDSGINLATYEKHAALVESEAILTSVLSHRRRSVLKILENKEARLVSLAPQLVRGTSATLTGRQARIHQGRYERLIEAAFRSLGGKEKRVESLSPARVLLRGYSITRRADGQIVRSIEDAPAGAVIFTELADGKLESIVEERQENSNGHQQ